MYEIGQHFTVKTGQLVSEEDGLNVGDVCKIIDWGLTGGGGRRYILVSLKTGAECSASEDVMGTDFELLEEKPFSFPEGFLGIHNYTTLEAAKLFENHPHTLRLAKWLRELTILRNFPHQTRIQIADMEREIEKL